MKKILISILCIFIYFFSSSQTLRINKYLVDSMLTPNHHILYYDSAHNGTWQAMATRTFALNNGGGSGSGTVTSVAAGFGHSFSTITTTGSVIADTTSGGLLSWVRGAKLADSLGAIISTKGVGTVTSVSAGYGTNFTTITGTGSVIVDTFSIATRARVQKPIDSLGVIIATKATGTINSGVTNKPAYYTASTTIDDFAAVDYATSGTNVKVTTQNTTDVGLEIKGVSSQSGNYLNISSSASTADLLRFTSAGELWINKTTDKGNYDIQATRGIFVDAVPANNEGLYMIATSGAGNYFVIQNSGGTVWQSVAGGGMLYDIATSGGGSIKFSPSLTGMANITTTGLHVGSSTIAATSKLQVGGSFGTKYDSTAVGITLDATHNTVGVTATGQTITLPTAASIAGREYTIVLTATGSCTIATTSSQLIAHATTYTLSAQDKYVTVKSTGANWVVVANNGFGWITIIFIMPLLSGVRRRKFYYYIYKQAA